MLFSPLEQFNIIPLIKSSTLWGVGFVLITANFPIWNVFEIVF